MFFWNSHLAFFVGDQGYICRYGLEVQQGLSARGPGRPIDDVIDGTIALTWDLQVRSRGFSGVKRCLEIYVMTIPCAPIPCPLLQGSDEQGLNWGRIIDNKDYMYSDLKAVFCLTTDEQDLTQWFAEQMDAEAGITYSQHITCYAVGTHPGTAGTTSAILRYQSQAVPLGTDPPTFNENVQVSLHCPRGCRLFCFAGGRRWGTGGRERGGGGLTEALARISRVPSHSFVCNSGRVKMS